MRSVLFFLAILLGFLQYKLWIAEGNVFEVWQLKERAELMSDANESLLKKNQSMYQYIAALKKDDKAIEAQARSQLGMVRPGETYYQIVEQ